MNLEEYRMLFAAVGLVLIAGAALPGLSVLLQLPSGERFSELWLLGPERMAEGYPYNVEAGQSQGPVYLGVGNHMGCSEYYMVYVKFRNQTQPLPNVTACEPSPLPPLYEFRFFLGDGEVWETPLTFKILELSVMNDSLSVGEMAINDETFSVDCHSRWDSEYEGFFCQLFFELWLYDMASASFRFHNRFVGIWLKISSSE